MNNIKKKVELLRQKREKRMDEWITINGAHVEINDEGEITGGGAAAKAINSHTPKVTSMLSKEEEERLFKKIESGYFNASKESEERTKNVKEKLEKAMNAPKGPTVLGDKSSAYGKFEEGEFTSKTGEKYDYKAEFDDDVALTSFICEHVLENGDFGDEDGYISELYREAGKFQDDTLIMVGGKEYDGELAEDAEEDLETRLEDYNLPKFNPY